MSAASAEFSGSKKRQQQSSPPRPATSGKQQKRSSLSTQQQQNFRNSHFSGSAQIDGEDFGCNHPYVFSDQFHAKLRAAQGDGGWGPFEYSYASEADKWFNRLSWDNVGQCWQGIIGPRTWIPPEELPVLEAKIAEAEKAREARAAEEAAESEWTWLPDGYDNNNNYYDGKDDGSGGGKKDNGTEAAKAEGPQQTSDKITKIDWAKIHFPVDEETVALVAREHSAKKAAAEAEAEERAEAEIAEAERAEAARAAARALVTHTSITGWLAYPRRRRWIKAQNSMKVCHKKTETAVTVEDCNLPSPNVLTTAYLRSEAVEIVIQRTVAGTTERRNLVKKMVERKYIPSEKTIRNLLMEVERGDLVAGGRWRSTGQTQQPIYPMHFPKHFKLCLPRRDSPEWRRFLFDDHTGVHDMSQSVGLTRYEEYQKYNSWWGTVIFKVAPLLNMRSWIAQKSQDGSSVNQVGSIFFEEGHRAAYNAQGEALRPSRRFLDDERSYHTMNITMFLGQQKDDPGYEKWCQQGTSLCRLYFSPNDFPPPAKGTTNIGQCPGFESLRVYIRLQAAKCGSPVICDGKGPSSRIFRCCNCRDGKEKVTLKRKREGDGKQKQSYACNFHFFVKWDEYGFYIHLNKYQSQAHLPLPLSTVGYPYHSCAPRKNVLEGEDFGIKFV